MLTLGCGYAAVGILFILGIHYLELTGDPDCKAARMLDSIGSALSSRRVKLAVLGGFFATLLVALVKPVPLLERSGLPITHRVFSARVDQRAVYNAGGFGVGFAEEYGCLEIRNALVPQWYAIETCIVVRYRGIAVVHTARGFGLGIGISRSIGLSWTSTP